MIGEQEFIIKARDELSATLAQLRTAASRFGDDTKTSFEKARKGADSYSAWMRAERTNQREQNFLFRQLREVVGGAALSLTLFGQSADSAANKNLSRSLNEGFLAFQGIEFTLGQINPMLGLIAGGVAGVAVALAGMDKELSGESFKAIADSTAAITDAISKLEPAKVQALRDYVAEINKIGREREGASDAVEKTADAFERLQNSAPDVAEALARGLGGPRSGDDLNRQTAALIASKETLARIKELRETLAEKGVSEADIQLQIATNYGIVLGAVDAVADSTEKQVENEQAIADRVRDRALAVADVVKRTDDLNALVAKIFPLETAQTRTILERLELARALGIEEFTRLTIAERQLRVAKEATTALRTVPVTRPDFNVTGSNFTEETILRLDQNFQSLGVTAENTAGLITNSMQAAAASIVDVMFGATESIGQMFENLAKSISTLFIEEILKVTVASFIGNVLGFAGFLAATPGPATASIPSELPTPGSIAPSASGGGPIGRAVNIFINGEKIAATPRTRKEFTDAVADAVFLEKYAW